MENSMEEIPEGGKGGTTTHIWKSATYGSSETISFARGFIRINCYYEVKTKSDPKPAKYRFTVNGFKSKLGYDSMEDCKKSALNTARKLLDQAKSEMGWFE